MDERGKSVAAADLKTSCFELLDEVARTRRPLVITKRGRPVARLVPLDARLLPSLEGSVSYHGDIVSPIGDAWDVGRPSRRPGLTKDPTDRKSGPDRPVGR